jgi:hypothetical protein
MIYTFMLMLKLLSCVDILHTGTYITYTYSPIIGIYRTFEGKYLSKTDMYGSNV